MAKLSYILFSYSLSFSLLAPAYSHAETKLSSNAVLKSQGQRINSLLRSSYPVYAKAKAAYEKQGPKAFVDIMSASTSYSAQDRKDFIRSFRGLPELPELQLGQRGFALIDKRKGYRVEAKIIDLDKMVVEVNGQRFDFDSTNSFQKQLQIIQPFLNMNKVSYFENLKDLIIPKAHAAVPALFGGIVNSLIGYVFGKSKEKTTDNRSDRFVAESPNVKKTYGPDHSPSDPSRGLPNTIPAYKAMEEKFCTNGKLNQRVIDAYRKYFKGDFVNNNKGKPVEEPKDLQEHLGFASKELKEFEAPPFGDTIPYKTIYFTIGNETFTFSKHTSSGVVEFRSSKSDKIICKITTEVRKNVDKVNFTAPQLLEDTLKHDYREGERPNAPELKLDYDPPLSSPEQNI